VNKTFIAELHKRKPILLCRPSMDGSGIFMDIGGELREFDEVSENVTHWHFLHVESQCR